MHSIVRRLKSKVLHAKVTPEGVGIIQLNRRVSENEFERAAKSQGLSVGFQKSKRYMEVRNAKGLVAVLIDRNHLVLPRHAHSKQAALAFAEALLEAKK